ncbi:unnamed protein product [Musa acuminata subsp. malaccensis]|uniref:(wild Malaysian banana) hypothetical protein n=1 Tax=Musa acuminata subsp. malaccensis TaxID=214687 RepID=A0A804K639_MUSAM|nr:unnamed protein product [Musa acuminata subsp. malaccensis]
MDLGLSNSIIPNANQFQGFPSKGENSSYAIDGIKFRAKDKINYLIDSIGKWDNNNNNVIIRIKSTLLPSIHIFFYCFNRQNIQSSHIACHTIRSFI